MKISELEGCISNKNVEIEKCLERLNEYENKLHKIGQTNQTTHMIMPSKDTMYSGRKEIDLDTFSSVRIPKHSDVIWKKKGSSNTYNVDLSSTSSAYVCNDAMNVFCNSRMCDLFDENNLFIFDDESVIISPVSKMPFRKKPRDSLNERSKRCSKHMTGNCALLTNFVEKFLETVRFGNNDLAVIAGYGDVKHMTSNRALLINFVKKFLGTVRFGNNDFAVITGYGDVVIRSMKIKKVYYVEGLGHNLFSVGQFCDKGLEVAFQKSTCFVRTVDDLPKMKFEKNHLCFACEQGNIHRKHHKSKTDFASNKPLYLLHMDLCGPMPVESINGKRYVLVVVYDYSRYTWVFFLHSKDEASENKTLAKFSDEVSITQQFSAARTPQQNGIVERRNRTLVEAARTMLIFANLPSFLWAEAIATACFIQNRSIIHKHFNKTPYELMNKRKPNIKFFCVFGCRCYLLNDYEDVGNLKKKMDIRVFVRYLKESAAFRIYNKRTRKIYESVNVNFDEISEMASKQFSLEPSLSNLNETGKSSNPSISQVSETSKKDLEDLFHNFYDEYFDSSKIMKSSTTNVETSINEEVFHEVSESFQEESFLSLLNDDVQQKDAYFDANTSFHDPSNVHTFYQPYPHEKKWTKDHPLHKIIGDPKSSVRIRGQLANSCLFSCLLSSIEPANVAEALKDANWAAHKDFTVFQMDVKTTFSMEFLRRKSMLVNL
nr:hypothetical protein [Tanacetum cinerariifolium]